MKEKGIKGFFKKQYNTVMYDDCPTTGKKLDQRTGHFGDSNVYCIPCPIGNILAGGGQPTPEDCFKIAAKPTNFSSK